MPSFPVAWVHKKCGAKQITMGQRIGAGL